MTDTINESPKRIQNAMAILGIFIAILAIALAMFQDPIREQVASGKTLKERVIEGGAALIGIEPRRSSEDRDWIVWAYSGVGLLAVIFGVVSYLRQENHRFSGMAGALGIIAIGWEYVLIGLIIAVVIYILANLGFDF